MNPATRRSDSLTKLISTDRLDDLSNVGKQRLDALYKFDRDTAEVVQWLRNNQTRFQKEILEPAFVSLEVPDAGYVDYVESCINATQLKVSVASLPSELEADKGLQDIRLPNSRRLHTSQSSGQRYHRSPGSPRTDQHVVPRSRRDQTAGTPDVL